MAVREWLDTPGGKIAAAVLVVAAAVAVIFAVRKAFGPPPEIAAANERVFIDAATGQAFEYTLKAGDVIPVRAPSGQETGYPAEKCYWTRDGQIKPEPTPVLLNQTRGKPGPTFCPDCGRLVVPHNPMPTPEDKPPPTEAEYRPRRGSENPGR